MRRPLRSVLAAVGWTLFGAFALVLAAYLHLRLPIVREIARVALADFVSGEIAGALAIGRLDRATLDEVAASHVALYDGSGIRIASARRLVLVPDVQASRAHGEVRISAARLSDAIVRLIDAGDGLPTFLSTFDAPPGRAPGTGEPLRAVVDGIALERVTIYGDFLGLRAFRAEDVRAHGRLEIGEYVRVAIDDARTTLVEPFGFPLEVSNLRGTVSGVETEGVALEADVARGDERAHVKVRFAAPEAGAPERLELEVTAQKLSPDTLRALGFEWIAAVGTPLSGKLVLSGPLDRLVVGADLDTLAGKARVDGTIDDVNGASDVSVTIASDALRLDQALVDGPELDVEGSVTIAMRPGETAPRIHAEVEPLLVGKLVLPGFVLDGMLEDGNIRVANVKARRGTAAIEGSGHVTSEGGVAMRLRVRVPDVAREEEIAALLPGAHGRLDADLHVDVAPSGQATLRLAGSVTLVGVRWGELEAKRLVVTGRIGGDLDLPNLDVRVRGEEVRYAGYVLGDAAFGASGRAGRYRVSGEFTRSGQRAFHVDADVKADRKGFVVNADPIELGLPNGVWRGAVRDLEIRHGEHVKLGLFRLASGAQRLEAKALVRERGEDEVEAQIQSFDLSALYALVGDRVPVRQGFTDTHLVLTGDLARPDVLLEGALRDGVLGEIEGIQAFYAVSYSDGQADLDVEVDLGEHGLVRADGRANVDLGAADLQSALRRGHYRMNLSAEELSLALVPAAARAGVAGRIGGVVRVYGDAATPAVSGNYVIAPLELPGWDPLFLRGEVGYTGGLFDVKATVLDDRGALAVVAGDMPVGVEALIEDPARLLAAVRDGPWRLRVQSATRPLADLPKPLARELPFAIGLDGQVERREATTTGLLRYGGQWTQPLAGVTCATEMKPTAQGYLRLAASETELMLSAFAGRERVASVTAKLGTSIDRWLADASAADAAILHVKSEVQVAAIERVPYLCEQGKGSLAARIEIGRVPGRPPTLSADAQATFDPQPLRVGAGRQIRVPSCGGDPARLHVEARATGETGRVVARLEGCGGGPATAEARVPMRWLRGVAPFWDERRSLDATITFEDTQLRPLLRRTPGLHGGQGVARGEIRVHGTPARPRLEGTLAVHGGRVYLVAPGQELDALDARFVLRGDWIQIEKLTASSGQGTLDVAGGVGLDGFVPRRVRVAMRANKLPMQREGVELAWLTGSAAVDAEIGVERTRAAFKLHELAVRLPDHVERALQPLDPHPEVVVTTDEPGASRNSYPIELAFDGRRGVRITRNDMRTEVATELAVSYVDPDLLVGGYVEILRGSFEVFGKEFTVEQGSMRFDGGAELNPDVRLVATHVPQIAGGVSVTVTVSGTLLEPDVRFASEACPGESGAVTYLISGQCAADDPELAAESEAAEDSYAAGIVGVLGGAVGTLYAPSIGGLRPRFAAESAGEGTATRVKAGVAVDDVLPRWMQSFVQRVYVQGAGTVGGEEDPEASTQSTFEGLSPEVLIELYFPYHLVGVGKYAPGLSWGVDVLWEP